jgi:hypothetical protein
MTRAALRLSYMRMFLQQVELAHVQAFLDASSHTDKVCG